jgi:PAS domain-containing protein
VTDQALSPLSPARSGSIDASVPVAWLMAAGDSLQDALGILVPLVDDDGGICDFRIRYANPAAATFAGLTTATIIGCRLLDLAPKLRQIGLFEVLASACLHQNPVEREIPLAMPGRDEQRVTVRARPVDGVMVVVIKDATELARARRETEDLLEHYRMVGSVTQDVLWDWDIPGDRLSIGSTLMGLPPGSPVAVTTWWSEGLHPEDRSAFDAMLQQLTTGVVDTWAGIYRFRHADGSYRLVLDRRRVLRDVDRRPVRMIGTLSDLTGMAFLST